MVVLVIDENIFPFNKKYIENYINPDRYGWYLQQLLKLYAIFLYIFVFNNTSCYINIIVGMKIGNFAKINKKEKVILKL